MFGKSAKKIHDFGKGSADAVGLSTNEFNKLATVTGDASSGYVVNLTIGV